MHVCNTHRLLRLHKYIFKKMGQPQPLLYLFWFFKCKNLKIQLPAGFELSLLAMMLTTLPLPQLQPRVHRSLNVSSNFFTPSFLLMRQLLMKILDIFSFVFYFFNSNAFLVQLYQTFLILCDSINLQLSVLERKCILTLFIFYVQLL